jgi:hypothetical protein
MAVSQVHEGGLAHHQVLYMSPKLFLLLACLKFHLRDNISKKNQGEVAEGEQSIFSICFKLTRSSRPYL